MTNEEITTMIGEALKLHSLGDEHAALRTFIEREERRREMWDKIVTSTLGAIIIGVCFWVGSHVLELVRYSLK